MKKIISLLALTSMLFTANNVDAKNDKTSETITTNKVTILKKVFKKNKHTYKEAYKYDKKGSQALRLTALYFMDINIYCQSVNFKLLILAKCFVL